VARWVDTRGYPLLVERNSKTELVSQPELELIWADEADHVSMTPFKQASLSALSNRFRGRYVGLLIGIRKVTPQQIQAVAKKYLIVIT